MSQTSVPVKKEKNEKERRREETRKATKGKAGNVLDGRIRNKLPKRMEPRKRKST